MTSLPLTMGKILRCWIADGFSKPKTSENLFTFEIEENITRIYRRRRLLSRVLHAASSTGMLGPLRHPRWSQTPRLKDLHCCLN